MPAYPCRSSTGLSALLVLLPSLYHRGQRRPRLEALDAPETLFASAMPPPYHVPVRTAGWSMPTLRRARHGEEPRGETRADAAGAAGWAAPSRRRRGVSGADDGHASRAEGLVMRRPWVT